MNVVIRLVRSVSVLTLSVLTLASCASSGGNSASVRHVSTVDQCSVRMARLDIFEAPQQWQAWQQQNMPSWRVQTTSAPLLQIGLGVRPTPGYGLDITHTQLVGNTLKISALSVGPPPDRIMAQVITTPCILVALPAGSYSKVELKITGEREQTLAVSR